MKISRRKLLASMAVAPALLPIAGLLGQEPAVHISGAMLGPHVDAQRMYNYWQSRMVEMMALKPRAPWIGGK